MEMDESVKKIICCSFFCEMNKLILYPISNFYCQMSTENIVNIKYVCVNAKNWKPKRISLNTVLLCLVDCNF